MPSFLRGETLRLNDNIRSGLPGSFIQLSDGVCHYDLAGPVDGAVVVLLHGFSIPYFIWDPTFDFLTKAGFRVLRYDMYGRGFSDRPAIDNSSEMFRLQLENLIDSLEISSKINLVSLSMGAIVAAEFAAQNSQSVEKMIFIDPAGFDLKLSWMVKALRLRPIGEILLGAIGLFGNQKLVQSILQDFYDPSQGEIDAFVPRYLEQMEYEGFTRSLLSTLRNGLLDENMAIYQSLEEHNFPTQLIWGKEDKTIAYAHHEAFLELLPSSEFHAIDKAGHIPHFERPEVVNPILVDFLNSSLQ
jgi:pimeloyl-ACP methyl ester carboxylesterase